MPGIKRVNLSVLIQGLSGFDTGDLKNLEKRKFGNLEIIFKFSNSQIYFNS